MKSMHLCFVFCALAFNGDAVGNEQLCAQQTWSMTLESVTAESGDTSEEGSLWYERATIGFWAGNDGLNLDNGYLGGARTDEVQFALVGVAITDTGEAR